MSPQGLFLFSCVIFATTVMEQNNSTQKGDLVMYEDIVGIYDLDRMPFDKYEDGKGFIHATGRVVVFKDGRDAFEYEDWDDTISLPSNGDYDDYLNGDVVPED